MKKTLLMILLLMVSSLIPAVVKAGDSCGDSARITSLFHEAIFATDRADAESRLVSAIFPVVSCLSREGYLATPSGIPGRFVMVVEVLSALNRQSVRMSTAEDVDRQIRLWKVKLSERK